MSISTGCLTTGNGCRGVIDRTVDDGIMEPNAVSPVRLVIRPTSPGGMGTGGAGNAADANDRKLANAFEPNYVHPAEHSHRKLDDLNASIDWSVSAPHDAPAEGSGLAPNEASPIRLVVRSTSPGTLAMGGSGDASSRVDRKLANVFEPNAVNPSTHDHRNLAKMDSPLDWKASQGENTLGEAACAPRLLAIRPWAYKSIFPRLVSRLCQTRQNVWLRSQRKLSASPN